MQSAIKKVFLLCYLAPLKQSALRLLIDGCSFKESQWLLVVSARVQASAGFGAFLISYWCKLLPPLYTVITPAVDDTD